MKNIRLLTEILTTTHDYWVVDRVIDYPTQRDDHQIIFIGIPGNVPRGLAREDIKLSHLEDLQRTEIIGNMFLNWEYPPFQQGITFYDICKGFALTQGHTAFLKLAVDLQSEDLFKFQQIAAGPPTIVY